MRAVPENMEAQALSEQITALEQNVLLAQNRLQKANTALEHARLALARTEEQLGIFTKQLTEKTILLQQKQTDFHRLMSESELDEDVYRMLLPKLPEISARRKALEQHKIEYRSKRDALQQLKVQTASLQEHNLDEMTARKQEAMAKRDALQQQYNRQAQRLHTNTCAAQSLLSCTRLKREARSARTGALSLRGCAR